MILDAVALSRRYVIGVDRKGGWTSRVAFSAQSGLVAVERGREEVVPVGIGGYFVPSPASSARLLVSSYSTFRPALSWGKCRGRTSALPPTVAHCSRKTSPPPEACSRRCARGSLCIGGSCLSAV